MNGVPKNKDHSSPTKDYIPFRRMALELEEAPFDLKTDADP